MHVCSCSVVFNSFVTTVDYSQPGSSVHGILQARILEWVAIPFPRGSCWPRDQTHVSCIGRWSLYHWATRETLPPAIIRRPTEFWRFHWVFSLLLDSSWSRCKLNKFDLAILLVLSSLPSLDNFPLTEEDQKRKRFISAQINCPLQSSLCLLGFSGWRWESESVSAPRLSYSE